MKLKVTVLYKVMTKQYIDCHFLINILKKMTAANSNICIFFVQNRMRKDSTGPFTQGCRKILGVIVVSEPSLLKRLKERAKILDKIVEGMGQHGLVGTTDESLMPLHDALKLEFQRVVETYKGALCKLEELALSNKNNPKSVAKGPAPVSASHQRQLSLR
jgi:hypothetical protein